MRKYKSNGFTLIELSIVLVIIGLMVGGILVGTDLIYAAKIRRDIKQLEQLDTLTSTFKNKYNCLPGDCENISRFFPQVLWDGSGAPMTSGWWGGSGNGDGRIFQTNYSMNYEPATALYTLNIG